MALTFIACDGEWTQGTGWNSSLTCDGDLRTFHSTYELMSAFDYSSLDPAILGGFFGAGFTLVGSFIILGKAVSTILRTIKEN